jgi:hypothetical protein
VKGFRFEREHESATNPLVWTFYLERHDISGNPLPSIPVEMRGASFKGFIHEGDTVEIYEPWQEGSLVQAERVYNKTRKMEVKAIGRFDLFGITLGDLFKSGSLFSIIFIGMLAVVLLICLAAVCVMAVTMLQFARF